MTKSKWNLRKTIIPIIGPAFAIIGFIKVLADLGYDPYGPYTPYFLAALLIIWTTAKTIKEHRAARIDSNA